MKGNWKESLRNDFRPDWYGSDNTKNVWADSKIYDQGDGCGLDQLILNNFIKIQSNSKKPVQEKLKKHSNKPSIATKRRLFLTLT